MTRGTISVILKYDRDWSLRPSRGDSLLWRAPLSKALIPGGINKRKHCTGSSAQWEHGCRPLSLEAFASADPEGAPDGHSMQDRIVAVLPSRNALPLRDSSPAQMRRETFFKRTSTTVASMYCLPMIHGFFLLEIKLEKS